MVVKGEPTLVRDSNGFVRLEGTVKMSDAEFREVIEQIYVKAHVNLAKKQLAIPFEEYYASGVTGPKGRHSRPWTDDEEKVVLLHHDEDNEAIGKRINRSFMAVKHRKSDLLSEFLEWLEGGGKGVKDKSRAEQIDAFFKAMQEGD